jgi:predicted nuclease with TOPRIM domain
MGGIGYWYYNDTQQRMAILQENNAKLEIAVETNEAALESLQVSYASAQQENTRLNEAYTSIRRQNQQLADKLQQIDLTAAAIVNAESIERAVNRGTENAGRCFELLSGAELTEKERNAKNGIAFNKECPWFYDTYKSRGLLNTATAD